MKKVLAVLLTVAVLSGVTAWANCGGCPGDEAKVKAPAKCDGTAALDKLKLTDEQKAKVADLQKSCAKATSKSECRKTCADGLKNILTAEQYKEWEAACQPAQCPMGGKKACAAGCAKPCCAK